MDREDDAETFGQINGGVRHIRCGQCASQRPSPSERRFLSPDSIVPTQTQGTQAWDRYAFVNNNPVRYNDPTGHMIEEDHGRGVGGSIDTPDTKDNSGDTGGGGKTKNKPNDNHSNCTNLDGGGTRCEVYISPDQAEALENVLIGVILFDFLLNEVLLAGGGTLLGTVFGIPEVGGVIGGIVGGLLTLYDGWVFANGVLC